MRKLLLRVLPHDCWGRKALINAKGLARLLGILKYPGESDSYLSARVGPVVSIVIPVFEKTAMTFACICALRQAQTGTTFEVIVVDDGSSFWHARRLQQIRGVHLVRLPKNVGYLRACNEGVSRANGEFVVMLNNDTLPQDGWLDALIADFEDPNVGLVGSKLLYPDGRLQIAGAIMFRDGTVDSYGAGKDAGDPRFNYRRDVDFCAGASIAIRK